MQVCAITTSHTSIDTESAPSLYTTKSSMRLSLPIVQGGQCDGRYQEIPGDTVIKYRVTGITRYFLVGVKVGLFLYVILIDSNYTFNRLFLCCLILEIL